MLMDVNRLVADARCARAIAWPPVAAALATLLALPGCSSGESASDARRATGETIFSYNLATAPKGASTSSQGVEVSIHGEPDENGPEYATFNAAIRFSDGNLRVANLGSGPIDIQRDVWIGKLSRSDQMPSVIFSNETGGNRCCSELTIIAHAYGRDTPMYVQTVFGTDLKSSLGDFNRDGTKDFVTFDPRFLGAFITHSYGAYHLPKVVNVFKDQLVDISSDPSLRPYWTSAQARAGEDCADPNLTDNSGACATYVAIGARLGKVEEAISVASVYLQKRDDPYYVCGFATPENGECPEDELRQFDDFPSAIKFALQVYGYI